MSLLSKLFGKRTADAGDAPSTPPPGGVLTPTQFAEHYVRMLKVDAPEIQARRVDTEIHLSWRDGGTMKQFLRNAYASYVGDPDALDAVLQAQLASARSSAAPQDPLNLDLVLPVIKTTQWLQTVQREAHPDHADFVMVSRALVGDLIVAIAQDRADAISYVNVKDLAGVCDEAELFERAMINLARRADDLVTKGGGGRYRVELDGFFDASLVLIAEDWLAPLGLQGDPVFAMPCREQLMVCGSSDERSVASLAEITPEIARGSAYAISDVLYVLKGGELRPL